MSFTFFPVTLMNPYQNEQAFYSVIDRLKSQNILPKDSFIREVPFFNIPPVSKETHIKELFEDCCDLQQCKKLLNEVAPLPQGAEYKLVPQNYSSVPVMSFAQIVLYKVLPCTNVNCSGCPREIVTHNQYKDLEFQCPFYHHERDRRRLVLHDSMEKEFAYKANYFDETKCSGDKESYSQNYFESMFHPLYYKMFRCKRDFCRQCPNCPFFHNEEEKNLWDSIFTTFLGKDRASYVKDKQRPADKKTWSQEGSRKGSDDGIISEKRVQTKRQNKKDNYQQCNQQMYYGDNQMNFGNYNKVQANDQRKSSNDSSFEENSNYGFFSKLKSSMNSKIY